MSLWKIAQYFIGSGRGIKRQTPASRHYHASTPVTRCVQILQLYSGSQQRLLKTGSCSEMFQHSFGCSKVKVLRSALR